MCSFAVKLILVQNISHVFYILSWMQLITSTYILDTFETENLHLYFNFKHLIYRVLVLILLELFSRALITIVITITKKPVNQSNVGLKQI